MAHIQCYCKLGVTVTPAYACYVEDLLRLHTTPDGEGELQCIAAKGNWRLCSCIIYHQSISIYQKVFSAQPTQTRPARHYTSQTSGCLLSTSKL